MASSQNAKLANELKLKGNKAFTSGKYLEAIGHYTAAIECDTKNALLYSNRSITNLKLNRPFEAERDADAALRLDSTLDKAYYRRAMARRELCRYPSALRDLKRTLELSPNNAEAKRELESLKSFLENNKSVKLIPISKPEAIRSKVSLKSLPIQFEKEEEDEVDVQVIPEQLNETIRKLVLERTPTNPIEFQRDWREFTTSADRLVYLEKLSVDLLQRLFHYQIEPKLFQELIAVLEVSKDESFVLDLLTILSKTTWLPLTVMLLDDECRCSIGTILSRITDSPQRLSSESDTLKVLHLSFGLE